MDEKIQFFFRLHRNKSRFKTTRILVSMQTFTNRLQTFLNCVFFSPWVCVSVCRAHTHRRKHSKATTQCDNRRANFKYGLIIREHALLSNEPIVPHACVCVSVCVELIECIAPQNNTKVSSSDGTFLSLRVLLLALVLVHRRWRMALHSDCDSHRYSYAAPRKLYYFIQRLSFHV